MLNREPCETSNIIELIEATFDEVCEHICKDLRESNPEYMELMSEIATLIEEFPIIDNRSGIKGDVHLSAEENTALSRYQYLTILTGDLERLHIYLRGHRDSYAILKQIGAL